MVWAIRPPTVKHAPFHWSANDPRARDYPDAGCGFTPTTFLCQPPSRLLASRLMKLYFLRHGKADWPNWDKPDDERPLNKQGRREMARIAKFLRSVEIEPSLILSSPLPRARQTAEYAAEALQVELKEEPALGKGFSAAKLRPLLKRAKGGDLMIVGHEPDFSTVIHALTGGDVKLGKGGLARVDLELPETTGRLVWLIPPKVARG